ncbi:hypothetical protein [Terrisporobacter sp.]|nr:hypothetical protein [Terrisporobacter sp.]
MSKCWDCKHINKSIHMKLEDENCCKYEKVEDRLLNKKITKS